MVPHLQHAVEQAAQTSGMTPRAVWFLAAMVAALAVGTAMRVVRQRWAPTPQSPSLLESLKTWWGLIAVLIVAVMFGRTGVVLAIGALSFLAVREFLMLLPRDSAPRNLFVLAYMLIPLQYLWIWLDWEFLGFVFLPLTTLVLVPAVRMMSAPPRDFIASIGGAAWAIMLGAYGVSHAALLYTLPDSSNPVGGAAGWLMFLLLITEVNDMGQALWGRAIGAHKATPHISPNKTWEGFVGGAVTALVLTAVLAPWITPLAQPPPRFQNTPVFNLPYIAALAVGATIAVGGIVGDLTISACKRDRGVKDAGTILPGHGGVLDRFDSLTMTAPLYFHLVRYLDY